MYRNLYSFPLYFLDLKKVVERKLFREESFFFVLNNNMFFIVK